MTQVVQAKCPHCQRMLRIPAAWVAQVMKCKHCQQVFQAKRPVETPGPVHVDFLGKSTPATGDVPSNTPARQSASLNPFSIDLSPPRASRRRQRGWFHGALVFVMLVAIAGGVLILVGPHVSGLLATKEKQEIPRNKVVVVPNLKTDAGGQKEHPLATDGNTFFPRRALLINVSNYLLFNPLHHGNPREAPPGKYPGSSTAVLADTMNRPPLNLPATQITELADAGKRPFATSKAVIENTLIDFLDASRAQDRVIVLFTGHGIEIDKEAYLVPVDGDRQNIKTLLPLAWVYEKIAQCRARQKLLIVDVFRYPPARGEELPGTGAMTEDFEAKLVNTPAGVQVWASCTKGQQSIELEGGSVFMQALCAVLQERLPGIQEPTSPLPLEIIVPKVNQRLKEILSPQKLEQQSRLTGTAIEAGAAYDAAESLPPKLVLKAVSPKAGAAAEVSVVKGILDEINQLPPVRSSQKQPEAASLPGFSAKVLDEYVPDYKTWSELVAMSKDKEKYPLRAAVLEAVQVLKDSEKIVMRETLTNPGGPITPQVKSQFAATQQEPGIMIFHMETALAALKAAGAQRDKETSKRWRAHYDYALARLQSRLVYVYEYNNILAQVRSDSLPSLEPIHNGWRVGSQKKVQISEPKVKEMLKNIAKTWKRIAEENPGTPWAILANRESMTALGLVWRPSRD